MKTLVYDKLFVGKRLPSCSYKVEHDQVRDYVEAIGEDWSFYVGRGIVPLTMAAIYTLMANRTEGPLPLGSIHVSQEFEFMSPVRFGNTLVTTATVMEKYLHRDKKYVVLQAETINEYDELVVRAKTVGIWGE